MTVHSESRRQFLKLTAGVTALGAGTQGRVQGATSAGRPLFELGLASYTLRKFDLDQTLAMTQRAGLKNIAFKSMHLALDSTPQQIAAVVKQVKQASLELYGAGEI